MSDEITILVQQARRPKTALLLDHISVVRALLNAGAIRSEIARLLSEKTGQRISTHTVQSFIYGSFIRNEAGLFEIAPALRDRLRLIEALGELEQAKDFAMQMRRKTKVENSFADAIHLSVANISTVRTSEDPFNAAIRASQSKKPANTIPLPWEAEPYNQGDEK